MSSEVRAKLGEMVTSHLKRDTATFALGKLDSLSVIRMIVQLETLFDLSIVMHEITNENFGSFDLMVAYVSGKLAGGMSEPTKGSA